jgi:hypothetical protein
MNGHNKDWQLALHTMFQMPFLFVFDPKVGNLCCKSFFQLRKFVLIYLITLFQQDSFCKTRSYWKNEQNFIQGQKF